MFIKNVNYLERTKRTTHQFRSLMRIAAIIFVLSIAVTTISSDDTSDDTTQFVFPGFVTTKLELLNLNTEAATVRITAFDGNGDIGAWTNNPLQVYTPAVIPGNGSIRIDPASTGYLSYPNLSGAIESDQPLAVVTVHEWTNGAWDPYQVGLSTGESPFDGSLPGSNKLCFPTLFTTAAANGGTVPFSAFSIQNTGPETAIIDVKLYRRDGFQSYHEDDVHIQPGAKKTYDTRSLQVSLGMDWSGSAVVTVQNSQKISGIGTAYYGNRTVVYNAPHCGLGDGGYHLAVPSHYRYFPKGIGNAPAIWSALNIMNVSAEEATVILEYEPRDAESGGQPWSFYCTVQGYSTLGLNTSGGGDCKNDQDYSAMLGKDWDGTVDITSNKPIAATVLTQWERANNEIEGSMYRAVDVAEAQNYTDYLIPNVKKIQNTECSALLVHNIGTSTADITTWYFDREGVAKLAHGDELESGQGIGYNTCGGTGNTSHLPIDFEGHAYISSDQPLAVILNSINSLDSATASTNAIPLY